MREATIAITSGVIASLLTFFITTMYRKSENSSQSDKKRTTLAPKLVDEYLNRNMKFMDIKPLRESTVVVIGLGGVGSHCVHMLARSGIGKIRIVDFDLLTLSSLNRHALGTLNDVGHSKCGVLERHLQEICPFVEIESVNKLYNEKTCSEILSGRIDYVVDCIDNIDTKVHLIEYCIKNKIKIISSMGSGGKADPTKVKIADLSETVADPLSKALRRRLKAVGVFNLDVVFSTEVNSIGLCPPQATESIHDYSVLPNFRSSILPVLGPLPAIFGNAIALFIITRVCKYKIDPLHKRFQRKALVQMYNDYKNDERKKCQELYLTFNDFVLLLEEIYQVRSIISNQTTGLILCRVDLNMPMSLTNAMLVTKSEKLKYEQKTLKLTEQHLDAIHTRLEQLNKY